ncbi:MAG: hypothetical protein ABUM51_02870 [Bacteroidota bacterium]
MGFNFLKRGNRHVFIAADPLPTKREQLSKLAALMATSEDATPADRAAFSKIDTSTWPKEKVDKVWSILQAMRKRGEFNLTK